MRTRQILASVLLSMIAAVGVPAVASAAYPGANGAIALARNGRIWVVQPNGTQANLARGYEPAWSPDGTRIAYVRERRSGGRHNGLETIWIMQADGSGKTRITSKHRFSTSPSWSPDGTRLVFASNSGTAGFELYTIGVEGVPAEVPVRLTDSPGWEGHPTWSPDGTRIAFEVFSNFGPTTGIFRIGVVAADGGDYTLMTPATTAFDLHPDWSPDSASLVFDSNRHNPGEADYDVYTMAADGGRVTRVTTAPGSARNAFPVWSPDGTKILYVHESRRGATTVRKSALDGAPVERVCRTDRLFFLTSPSWQPLP